MKSTVHPTHKGILKAAEGMKRFSLTRFPPARDMAYFIEHYWLVCWDLRGQVPYRQTVLSYPNVNVAFEQDQDGAYAGVYGVPRTTFSRLLRGTGLVLGVKFRPGGFYPFLKRPVSQLTGHTLNFRDVFGMDGTALEEQIFAQEDGAMMARLAEHFLREREPERDENVEWVERIVQAAMEDREMIRVEDMARQFGIGKRALQRLFSRYVGVSPKWVIQRYRLQEAAELIEKHGVQDWGKLSQDLGYYDQAHFIKDFKKMIGRSPEEYVRDLQ